VQAENLVWSLRASGVTNWLNDIGYFKNAYYAVGTQGTVVSSPDLVNWRRVPCVSGKSLYSVVAARDEMLVAGIEGVILRGQTAPSIILDYDRVGSTNRFLFSGIPGRGMALQSSSDLKSWMSGPRLEWLSQDGLMTHYLDDAQLTNQRFFKPIILP
jgi:hypothetical protein